MAWRARARAGARAACDTNKKSRVGRWCWAGASTRKNLNCLCGFGSGPRASCHVPQAALNSTLRACTSGVETRTPGGAGTYLKLHARAHACRRWVLILVESCNTKQNFQSNSTPPHCETPMLVVLQDATKMSTSQTMRVRAPPHLPACTTKDTTKNTRAGLRTGIRDRAFSERHQPNEPSLTHEEETRFLPITKKNKKNSATVQRQPRLLQLVRAQIQRRAQRQRLRAAAGRRARLLGFAVFGLQRHHLFVRAWVAQQATSAVSGWRASHFTNAETPRGDPSSPRRVPHLVGGTTLRACAVSWNFYGLRGAWAWLRFDSGREPGAHAR